MIPRPSLIRWQEKVRWPSMAQVEQDLILSRIIIEIYANPVLREHLVFRGGTALHKLFLFPAKRYSEDIDLVQIHSGPIGPLLKELRATLNPWLGKDKWKLSEGRATLYYRFTPEEDATQSMRVKIEINTREHFQCLDLLEVPHQIETPWYEARSTIKTYALEELMGTKLRALYQRKKGRDLFDFHAILQEHPNLDAAKIIECFTFYMDKERKRVSKAEFQQNMAEKLLDNVFIDDIRPLLKINDVYNPAEAYTLLETKLFSLLSGEPWKGQSETKVKR